MSRKVFVSFLGTGPANQGYEKVCYSCKQYDFKSTKTPFVQQATLQWIKKKDGCLPDISYILLTPKAKELNWNALRKRLAGMSVKYQTVEDLPDGSNEIELTQIFKAIDGILQKDDQIYLDVTHGFRYMPMLMLIAAHSAIITKKVNIVHVSYGGFLSAENKVAPLIDLLPMVKLLEATTKKGGEEAKTELLDRFTPQKYKILVCGEVACGAKEITEQLNIAVSKMNANTEFEIDYFAGYDLMKNVKKLSTINSDTFDFIIHGPMPHKLKGREEMSLENYVIAKKLRAKVFGQYKGVLNKFKIQNIAKEIAKNI
jgi:CRISPR-associated DxTHG motif protein